MLCPIVGAHFRPPAKDVLNMMPGGMPLTAKRQPDNPHDPDAVQVLVDGFSADGALSDIYKALASDQTDPDVLACYVDPLPLGYIGAKTGHAKILAEAMDQIGLEACTGILTFTPDGKPAIEIAIGDSSE